MSSLYRFPLVGIGLQLTEVIRTVTFMIVLIIKVRKSEDQSQETKNTLKIVGGVTLLIVCIFALVKLLHWIEVGDALGKQITYLGGIFCYGVVIPGIIIARSHKMTKYFKERCKEMVYNYLPFFRIQEFDDYQSR